MWVSILRVKFSDQQPPEAGAFEKNALPMLKQAPGFMGVVLLSNGKGEGGSVVYWQDQKSAEAAERHMASQRDEQLAQGGMTEIDRHGGELVFTDSKDPNRQPQPGLFIRSTEATVDPAKIDQVIAMVRDKAIPELRQQPGYVNANMIVNRQTGRMVTSTGWESAEQRKTSDAMARTRRTEAEDLTGAQSKVEEWETGFVHITEEAMAQVRGR